MPRIIVLILIAWATLFSPALAGGKKIILASLEWPPYVSSDLPGNGASGEIVRAAFKAVGYDLEIRFFPWARTLHETKENQAIVGFFPEYYSEDRGKRFLYSESIGVSHVGVITSRKQPIYWDKISDLNKYRIGVVRDYINTPEFDLAVAEGELKVEEATSDTINIRKVLAGRIDMAVTDVFTFFYLKNTDPQLQSKNNTLTANPQLLGVNELFVCFKKGQTGIELQRLFNEGLRQIDAKSMQDRYMEKYHKQHK